MNGPAVDLNLKAFQERADVDGLLRFVRASGRNEAAYQGALNDLKPVFEALSFGWHPQYEQLDVTALASRAAEITDIINWMAGSAKADMRTSAIDLMGMLGWQAFIPSLRHHLESSAAWEREAAVRATGRFSGEWTVEALRAAAERDPNAQVRDAALQQLQQSR